MRFLKKSGATRSGIFENPQQRDQGFWKILSNPIRVFRKFAAGCANIFVNSQTATGGFPKKSGGEDSTAQPGLGNGSCNSGILFSIPHRDAHNR